MSLAAIITVAALSTGVPPELLLAVCWTETNHRNVISFSDGGSPSYGVCQIKFQTARLVDKKVHPSDLFHPYTNARLAGLYLRRQLGRYRYNWGCASIAYNRGNAHNFCPRFDNSDNMKHTEYSKRVQEALRNRPWTR